MATDRDYDVIVFGGTGFTGGLTLEYLASHAPIGARIALAGRNEAKLATLRDRLAAINPSYATVPLLTAEVTDPNAMRELAASSKVVLTTVGPYLRFGRALVAACAHAGTDYVDLCGEPEFVDQTYLHLHDVAERTGARLVHACGFDSLPYDLGVRYTVDQLPDDVPIHVDAQLRLHATFSGGTFNSLLNAAAQPLSMLRAANQRRRAEPRPTGRRVRIQRGFPHKDNETQRWLIPMPTIDPQLVTRSAAALASYGPDFSYQQSLSVKRLPTVLTMTAGLAGTLTLAQIAPIRDRLAAIRQPGTGPSEETRARSWFRVRFTATAANHTLVTEVSGGDPGYDETAKMLSESALCLAFDDLPPTAGQVTAAAAMGPTLIARLVDAGIVFRVVHKENQPPTG